MKTFLKPLFIVFTLTLVFVSFARADLYIPMGRVEHKKLKNDPTYATANYKHLNKETVARHWKPELSIVFRIRKRKPQNIVSYRAWQRQDGPGDPAIVIPTTSPMAALHYKQQNVLTNPTRPQV